MSKKEQEEFENKVAAFLPEDAYSKEEIMNYINNDPDGDIAKAFNTEQRVILNALVNRILDMLDYHTDDDDQPHAKFLAEKLSNVEAKLRNHRHSLNETFSAKPEF